MMRTGTKIGATTPTKYAPPGPVHYYGEDLGDDYDYPYPLGATKEELEYSDYTDPPITVIQQPALFGVTTGRVVR